MRRKYGKLLETRPARLSATTTQAGGFSVPQEARMPDTTHTPTNNGHPAQHAPGPWEAVYQGITDGRPYGIRNQRFWIAETCMYTDGDNAANAHLIASAPDLLAWTIDAFHVLQRGIELMPIEQLTQWDGVRAVLETCPLSEEQLGIAKARGGA